MEKSNATDVTLALFDMEEALHRAEAGLEADIDITGGSLDLERLTPRSLAAAAVLALAAENREVIEALSPRIPALQPFFDYVLGKEE